MSDMGTIQNKIVSRDRKITRQSNIINIIHIISFLPKGASVKEAYSTLKIVKIWDFISLQNALPVKDVFEEEKSPLLLGVISKKLNTQNLHTTHSAMNQNAFVPIVSTEIHGINSMKYRSVKIWNKLQKSFITRQSS